MRAALVPGRIQPPRGHICGATVCVPIKESLNDEHRRVPLVDGTARGVAGVETKKSTALSMGGGKAARFKIAAVSEGRVVKVRGPREVGRYM